MSTVDEQLVHVLRQAGVRRVSQRMQATTTDDREAVGLDVPVRAQLRVRRRVTHLRPQAFEWRQSREGASRMKVFWDAVRLRPGLVSAVVASAVLSLSACARTGRFTAPPRSAQERVATNVDGTCARRSSPGELAAQAVVRDPRRRLSRRRGLLRLRRRRTVEGDANEHSDTRRKSPRAAELVAGPAGSARVVEQSGRGAVGHDGRQEGRDGRHRHRARRLRHPRTCSAT